MTTTNPSRHPERFDMVGDELVVGGVPVRRLTARVGSTPYFAYDRDAITCRVAEVREALGVAVDIGYAVRANPMPAVVHHLAGHVDWLEVASAGELALALDVGMPAERISIAGPGKTDDELRRAVAAGVLVELESEGEARRLTGVGAELGLRPRVAVRVNPDFTLTGTTLRMSGEAHQFGVDVEQVPAVLDLLRELDLGLEGFHLFVGSPSPQADLLVEAHRAAAALVLALADKAGQPLTYLNLGGGFGIPQVDDDPLDLAVVGEGLADLVARVLVPTQPRARVVLELGRFLVGEAGVYVTRVVDRKRSRGRTFVVVDGGLHRHLEATDRHGQEVGRGYPLVLGTRTRGSARGKVTVVGRLCTPLDVLGEDVDLADAEVGDLVVVFQAGAYVCSASAVNLLGRPTPTEVLI